MPTYKLLRSISPYRLGIRVPAYDIAVGIKEDDGLVGEAVDEYPVVLFARAESRSRRLDLLNIRTCPDPIEHRPLGIQDRITTNEPPFVDSISSAQAAFQ